MGRKFPTSQNISQSVEDIITEYLKSDKIGEIDKTQNKYGFIGNLKKPFSIITWLASKSVAYNGPGKDSTAGFLFYETQDGFNFKSIDNLIKQEPFVEDYTYTPNVVKFDDPTKDFKIIKYTVDRNEDLLGKLQRGAYSSERYYINPVSFKPDIRHFKSSDYMGDDGINNLGDEKITLPTIDEDRSLGDLPTRIFVGMLDVGTIEQTTTDKGWNDPTERNADPAKTQAQTMMRYNQLMSQIVEITIPLNTNLTAGGIIRCVFPSIDRAKKKTSDLQSSGLYMIRELAHYFDNKGSYTKLKIVRDSSGRKMIENNLLKTNFLGKDGFRWWIGQVAPEDAQGDQINQIGNTWGSRVKVRIYGYHPPNETELKNIDLPWAQVLLSPQGGSGKANRARSLRISFGDIVMGFF